MASESSSFAVTITQDLGGDAQSHKIYQALLSAAEAYGPSPSPAATSAPEAMFDLPSVSPVHFAAVSRSTTPAASLGFMTDRMQALASVVAAVMGVVLVLLALGALGAGARSMLFGAEWSRKRGTTEKKALLGGGVGGIGFGAVAVGGISASLTLIIVSRQDDPSMGGYGVLAIILCSSFLGAGLGGRFRWAARGFCALIGSTSLVLLFTLSFRISSLLPRLVLLAILLPIALLAAFFSRTSKSLSISSALAGAYLLVLGIDCFLHLGFVDALGLLVAASGVSVEGKAKEMVVQWGSGGAKGLLNGWWLLAIVGGAWQCWWGGENGEVEEAWNSYLSRFIVSHPSPRGAYSPPQSFLARLFSSTSRPSAAFTDIPGRRRRSPWDEDEEKAHGHGHETSDAWDSDVDAATLRESKAPARYRAKEEESDSEEEGEEDDELRRVKRGLWSPKGGAEDYDEMGMRKLGDVRSARPQSVLSGSTLVGGGGGSGAGSVGKSMLGRKSVDDSDSEDEGDHHHSTHQHADDEAEDARLVSSLPTLADRRTETKEKKPSTFRNLFNKSSKPASYRSGAESSSARQQHSPLASPTSSAPAHAVPATPSLIHALNRVQEAQRQARGAAPTSLPDRARVASGGSEASEGESGRSVRGRKASYDEWWKEVISKSGK